MHARMCARASLHTECPEARVPVPLEGASVSFAGLPVPVTREIGLAPYDHAAPGHARMFHTARRPRSHRDPDA